jgi:hypothetical protein
MIGLVRKLEIVLFSHLLISMGRNDRRALKYTGTRKDIARHGAP